MVQALSHALAQWKREIRGLMLVVVCPNQKITRTERTLKLRFARGCRLKIERERDLEYDEIYQNNHAIFNETTLHERTRDRDDTREIRNE